jgi:ESCRT-II complex subunit VPS22
VKSRPRPSHPTPSPHFHFPDVVLSYSDSPPDDCYPFVYFNCPQGFWAELLGFGDFYYELGIQIVNICYATRSTNGGLITLKELLSRLVKMRGNKGQAIEEDDLKRSIDTLKVFGNGYDVLTVGSQKVLVTVPVELSADHTSVLTLAQNHETDKFVTRSLVVERMRWDIERARRAINVLLKEGMCWVDDQGGSEPYYWFPSLSLGF